MNTYPPPHAPAEHHQLCIELRIRVGVALLLLLFFGSRAGASVTPVEIKFRGHMCADVPFTVTVAGNTENGTGQGCSYYSDTEWGTAKIVPDKEYTVSTGGAICSTHIQFDKKCFRLFVKGDPYDDWTETDEIDKYQTYDDEDEPQRDAGGSWQIVLTNKDQPEFGKGDAKLGSVAVGISLGSLPSGMPAGTLKLESETIGPVTYSPAALQAMTLSEDVEVLKNGNDLRQIYTWDGMADIVAVAGGLEVRFYSLADIGSKGGDGFYTVAAGATALKTWSFINPDQGATNRLKVSEVSPGATAQFNTYAKNSDVWALESGFGTQVRTSSTKAPATVNGEPVEVRSNFLYSSPATFETTTTTTYSSQAAALLADKLQAIEYPDGQKDTFGYETGTYDSGTRTFTAGPGTEVRQTTTHGIVQNPGVLAGKTTRDVVVTDAQGHALLEELHVYNGSAFSRVTQTWHTYDADGNLTASTRDGRIVYSAVWQWGYKTSETDETGITTSLDNYNYYNNQPEQLIKQGVPAAGAYAAQPDVTTWRSYDYYTGNLSGETISSGGLTTYSSTGFNYDGTIDYQIRNELISDYSYASSANGGVITTITRPGGGTEIREDDATGRLVSVTGTAVVAEYYTYGIDANGNEWKQVNYGSATSPNYVKTTSDWLGRAIKEERPAYVGTFVRHLFYNSKGQLWKETATGLADRLSEYDEMGTVVRSGLDMDGNGILELASVDRVDGFGIYYQPVGADWYRVTTQSTYLTDNDATATTSIRRERLTLPGNTLSEIRSTDTGSNETVQTTTVDRPNKLVTETITVPGSTTAAVTVTRNGVVQSASTTSVAAPTLFASDALGRQTGITDPRAGTTTAITYDDGQYASERVALITVGGQSIVQTYYSAQESNPGLLKSRTENGKTTYVDYNARGQVAHIWGAASYPTLKEYDAYGRLWKLHTFRLEFGWTGGTWPGSAGNGDVTTWGYQESTGLAVSKTDAAGKAVAYTYKSFGQVATRNWARGATTTYSYNGAGEVSGVDYSDATPDIAMTYDRAGNRKTTTDAAGLHTLDYTPFRQLKSDAITGSGILSDITVVVGYDELFRKSTIDASSGGVPILHHNVGYDPTSGRIQSVGNGTVSAGYGYLPNSNWLHTIAFSGGSAILNTTRQPDALDRLLSIAHSVPGKPASGSSFTYQYNAEGHRERATLDDNSFWSYGYNDRSEVTSGQRFWADDSAVAGMQFGYNFDAIGNRTGTVINGRTATYQPTSLNHYASRDVPGAVDVLGTAAADATVTVNNLPATRKGEFFHRELAVDNSVSAVFQEVAAVGVKNNMGPGGEDAVTTVSGNVFLSKSSEPFAHDDDGNLTSDGRWAYEWDGENRLISMTSHADAPPASRMRLTFDYDAAGRRIRKTVSRWSNPTNTYEQQSQTRFLYDGWNMLAEIDSTGAPLRIYLWGLDISGTLDETGGVGALLSITDSQGPTLQDYVVAADGSGNISILIASADSTVAASYRYGPFGELLSASGAFAASNPFSFSSKFRDSETGHLYYGHRFYSPPTGRWLSQEPLGEQASRNLYRFIENDPLNSVDYLGWVTIPIHGNPVELPWPGQFRLPHFTPPRLPQITLRPWRNTSHTMTMKRFPVTAQKPIAYWAKQVYKDLQKFTYFSPPNNSTVTMAGPTTAKFRSNWPGNWGQGILAAGTTLTYWNVVDLTFSNQDYKVTGTTRPGHILEGTRYWKAVPKEDDCSVTLETSARERSSNFGIELIRTVDVWDHQKAIWTNYFQNIGEHWKKSQGVEPGDVVTSP